MTETLTKEDVQLHSGVRPEDCAHIIDQRNGQNDIAESTVEGTEIVALCGYRFVSTKAPEGRPVCKACVAVFEGLAS